MLDTLKLSNELDSTETSQSYKPSSCYGELELKCREFSVSFTPHEEVEEEPWIASRHLAALEREYNLNPDMSEPTLQSDDRLE